MYTKKMTAHTGATELEKTAFKADHDSRQTQFHCFRRCVHLSELWDDTSASDIDVLPNLWHTTNVLSTLQQIIKRAGLKVWPRVWQNIPATRATELENEFGNHKATECCGRERKMLEIRNRPNQKV